MKSKTTDMDIFNFRNDIIEDYRKYIDSFLKIRDNKIKDFVNEELKTGKLWTNPLLQLNPQYKRGGTVTELVKTGVLHPECSQYFAKNGNPFEFHYHQKQAFETAKKEHPYILTTGTGSGKSITYVVPIFDYLLRHPKIEGVTAILVYPMNALINSQEEELNKFLHNVPGSHIRIAKYTGQENLETKTQIQRNPPHILLTNYVMLELMLSRTQEENLIASAELKFLVLDELHTYRGRQGADVAILIRKLRQRCGRNFLCIGTSATMSSEGTRSQRREVVADVASKLFGVEIQADNVIDETLEPAINRPEPTLEELQTSICEGLPPTQTLTDFQNHPLSYWIERNFGLENKENHFVRRTPITLEVGADKLAAETQFSSEVCREMLRDMFLWGSKVKGLAFRLHQFISQGGSVYSTLESQGERFLTLEGQYTTTGERLLYPLVFCRECGQDYYLVNYNQSQEIVLPQLPTTLDINPEDDDITAGYLTLDEPELWDSDKDEERLPDSWFSETKKGGRKVKKEYRKFIPQKLQLLPNGKVTTSALAGISCWFVPKPFRVCLNCGVVHDAKKNEFTKLSRLSSEGRSTATTLLSVATVNGLKRIFTGEKAQGAKILSFTDNRQDASLQAGHFNDFVQTSFLRGSLCYALKVRGQLTQEELADEVVQHMALSQADYARQVAEYGIGKENNQRAFKQLIEYRLYEDLRRGGRIVQPNLEECGLLVIEYDRLRDMCEDKTRWRSHPVLLQASPEERFSAAQALLNHLRRQLAIDAKFLQSNEIDKMKRRIQQAIKEPWVIDDNEELHQAKWATLEGTTNKYDRTVKLGTRSKIGRFLRFPAWSLRTEPLSETEYNELVTSLIDDLTNNGYLEKGNLGVQLKINSMIWRAAQLTAISPDILESKRLKAQEDVRLSVNRFFQDFYQTTARDIQNMVGGEHTGQVNAQKRQEREEKFRQGKLASLFCSPTMELGIDISDLSVVHLRNVPPSPANYAQRSGRAGRSGQGALVITYASTGSGHDQYFFQRQEQMVAGVVAPPRLELGNQELVKSHIYSIWLAHTGIDLGYSMNEILDLDLDDYPLKESIRQQLTLSDGKLAQCLQAAEAVLADTFCQTDLQQSSWYCKDWLQSILENAVNTFDDQCDRWRRLYKDADEQLRKARESKDSYTKGKATDKEYDKSEQEEYEAERQRALLVGQNQHKNRGEFEFYPYRYFASEGFLPGFNFPRLPVRAYIKSHDGGEFISRFRVVALRELAPGNIIYHEGGKFMIDNTKIPVGGIENQYKRVTVCFNCGYFHTGEFQDTCENCGAQIKPDARQNIAKLSRVLPMETLSLYTRRRERITCDEEERLKYGYNITTHYRYAEGKKESATVKAADGTIMFKLTYGATAQVGRINRGLLRSRDERGFKLDTKTGVWGNRKKDELQENLHTEVNLMVENTCNILIIEPVAVGEENREAVIATLQYTLETAIQAVYKLEPDELDSERLGEGKCLLFWEASEGGAGVLSQLLQQPDAFVKIADAALDICHFSQPKDNCVQACYECLLSYRNQLDHSSINRHLIKPWLDNLQTSTVEISGISREEQYQKLVSQTDANSDFERQVLREIYEGGYKLPDAAQEFIREANCKPDFVYNKERAIALFCDGSVHNHPEQQRRDSIDRDNLRYKTRYQVVTLRYDEDWRAKLEILRSL